VLQPQAYVKDASGQGTIKLKQHSLSANTNLAGKSEVSEQILGSDMDVLLHEIIPAKLSKVPLQNTTFRETAVTSRLFS